MEVIKFTVNSTYGTVAYRVLADGEERYTIKPVYDIKKWMGNVTDIDLKFYRVIDRRGLESVEMFGTLEDAVKHCEGKIGKVWWQD